jgi:hypothetical protein
VIPPAVTPYLAGTVNVAAGTVFSLLRLIQQQLDPNCSGGPREFSIHVTAGGIYIGGANARGPLSAANYGTALTAGQTKAYSSNYPGSQAPLASLSVLSTTGASTIHVEVIA